MRVLITGITGFAGSHLAEYLSGKKGIEVFGTRRGSSNIGNLSAIQRQIRFLNCDLENAAAVKSVLNKIKPQNIFHLAAQSSVPASLENPPGTIFSNLKGALNILEGVRLLGLKSVVHLAGSSEVYGIVRPKDMPIKETFPLKPVSPYGVSKALQDHLGYQYHAAFGVKVVMTRAFSHTGPRQREMFVASNFARQVAMIEAGRQKPLIRVGNLDVARDFSDVRDVVRAYWLAAQKARPGEIYNVCSGKPRLVREILNVYLESTSVKIRVARDPARMRREDIRLVVGDGSKFCRETGWKPQVPFRQTLLDLLNDWRKKIGA
jgi:GDP-4-dehydro-6-deoxy-D-mannose reductase